jgi:phosphoribosylformimino-5-aminoimidazole carboxamide ribotide isomerase
MIIPAIDIRGGKVVRLLKGDFDSETAFSFDPIELAKQYEADGAFLLHIVDLDAARDGSPGNRELILQMVNAIKIPAQVGGGIRDASTAGQLLTSGVHRVVIGSIAMKQPDVVLELLERYGTDRICVALDVRPHGNDDYRLTAQGWLESVSTPLNKLLDFYVKYNIEHILMTDVSRDGAMSGPNIELYRTVAAAYPSIKLQASGGVRSVEDLRELRAAGAHAAIVGKALLIGAVSLHEELEC